MTDLSRQAPQDEGPPLYGSPDEPSRWSGSWASPGPAWLFCPGDRADRWAKAADVADLVVIDLEDAVAFDAKAAARRDVVAALSGGDLDPATTIVRLNGMDTPWFTDDVEALRATPLRAAMLPKAAAPLGGQGLPDTFAVVALFETARGIATALEAADTLGCVAVAWGGQDLARDLGVAPLDGQGRLNPSADHARMTISFVAAATGAVAVDTVRTAVDDDEALHAEATAARELGFAAKLLIHPNQVPVVRAAFRPSEDELTWATHILAVAGDDGPAVLVDGEMVDTPVRARARSILARAD